MAKERRCEEEDTHFMQQWQMAQCKKDKRKLKKNELWDRTDQQNFSCWDLNCYISNKLTNKKAATTNRFLYTYYIHIYYWKEALVAFSELDKWGFKLEDQDKQWRRLTSSTDRLFLPLFLSPSQQGLRTRPGHRGHEVSDSNRRTANFSPLRDQRTKHFYCSQQ